MRKVLIIILLLAFCLGVIFGAIGNLSLCKEGKDEKFNVDLETEGEIRKWEQLWTLAYGDVDNDGVKELVLGVRVYNCRIWHTWIGEDLVWLDEIPYQADLLLQLYHFSEGQWKFFKQLTIEKNVDYHQNSRFQMRDFKIGDFNKDGFNEIFYQWQEQRSYAKIIQIRGSRIVPLYDMPDGRAISELRDVDKDGIYEVLEKGLTWHIATDGEQKTILKGHLLCIRIFKWDKSKGKWVFWKVVPDLEAEKKLTREEVFDCIGAKYILKGVPIGKLKEIYPRAFK
jgi:hypothetical protein